MFAFIAFIMVYFFKFINFIIIARVILSWIPHDRSNPIIRFIYDVSEPLFSPFRGKFIYNNIDFSPVIILIMLNLIEPPVINFFGSF